MRKTIRDMIGSLTPRFIYFAAFFVAYLIIYRNTLHTLALFSLRDEWSSHILLIPVISIFLLCSDRGRISASMRTSTVPGTLLILASAVH